MTGLRASYADFELGPVDLALERGATLVVLGPNGSGKSTLLRVLAGLEPATGGRILLGGRDITTLPAAQRGIGMVFQDLALFPHRSVRQNVEYGPLVQGWEDRALDERTEEMLRDFRLTSLAHRRPSELSGGERQRVAIARALAPRPALLLLDEPLAAADPRSSRALEAELKGYLRRTETPAVYVTHDLEEGSLLADRVAVLRDGNWVEEGRADRVLARPDQAFTAWFLGFNVLEGPRVPGAGLKGSVAIHPGDLRLVAPGTPGTLLGVVVEAGRSGRAGRALVRLVDPSEREDEGPLIEVELPLEPGGSLPAPGGQVGLQGSRWLPVEGSVPSAVFKKGADSRATRPAPG